MKAAVIVNDRRETTGGGIMTETVVSKDKED